MSKTSCPICDVKCVSCRWWRCNCWYNVAQVTTLIAISKAYPEINSDGVMLKKIRPFIEWGISAWDILSNLHLEWDEITEYIKNYKQELQKRVRETGRVWLNCEYAIGSSKLWAWAKCIHCDLERFYGQGNACSALINKQ